MKKRGKFLSAEELAAYLNIKQETIRTMARRGDIPGYKVGDAWRFAEREIEAWLTAHWNVGIFVGNANAHEDLPDDTEAHANIAPAVDKIVRDAQAQAPQA